MTGFEGIGDFDSDDPWQRYAAHQAAKGNHPLTSPRNYSDELDEKERRENKKGKCICRKNAWNPECPVHPSYSQRKTK